MVCSLNETKYAAAELVSWLAITATADQEQECQWSNIKLWMFIICTGKKSTKNLIVAARVQSKTVTDPTNS